MNNRIPDATYRLQLGAACTFEDATGLIPYLAALGISHVYCSPYLRARPGSLHGYDIIDHNSFHPEIGDAAGFARFVATLRAHGMGHMLDLVSNHMGVGGDDNAWWLDVLENGRAARHARCFDIHWDPLLERLRGRVLLPILTDHYGAVLESGALTLTFDPAEAGWHVRLQQHRLPVDPRTQAGLLGGALSRLPPGPDRETLEALMAASAVLPSRDDGTAAAIVARRSGVARVRRRLAALCAHSPKVQTALERETVAVNGKTGISASFDRLHQLLELQVYRLAHWRVASDEVNYRRFFDVNDLACLRMEQAEVFDAVHALVRELVARGELDGLRIDHVDGLYDPGDYTRRLRAFLPGYLVVEKILAGSERLADDWPVDGTTGYEFASLLDACLVDPVGEAGLARLHARFVGGPGFDQVLLTSKRLVIRTLLSSELTVVAHMADAIAQADRHTRDFTLNGLRDALAELAAFFPVYRTYVGPSGPSQQDRRWLEQAVGAAIRDAPAEDRAVYHFLRDLLLLQAPCLQRNPSLRPRVLEFLQRFQQYTVPVMAKGLEDTAGYRHTRLISRSEVGADPGGGPQDLATFHAANRERARCWPHAMLAGSTHDSKRSEDVRARLAVLSGLPALWRQRVFRWRQLNRSYQRQLQGARAPSRNDEYLFYQTLIGTWPSGARVATAAYCARMQDYMRKAIREAKLHTSWTDPDPDYEAAVDAFVAAVLRPRRAFLEDFLPFQRRVARLGAFNGLIGTLLRLTVPGVPDIYQGNELWRFDLVDPDNRRRVDFDRRRALLEHVRRDWWHGEAGSLVRDLAREPTDDRLKLLLVWRLLTWRRAFPEVFRHGHYRVLAASALAGSAVADAADPICAFARGHDSGWIVAAAERWPWRRDDGEGRLRAPDGHGVRVELPAAAADGCFDVITGVPVAVQHEGGTVSVPAAELFRSLPVALLAGHDPRVGPP